MREIHIKHALTWSLHVHIDTTLLTSWSLPRGPPPEPGGCVAPSSGRPGSWLPSGSRPWSSSLCRSNAWPSRAPCQGRLRSTAAAAACPCSTSACPCSILLCPRSTAASCRLTHCSRPLLATELRHLTVVNFLVFFVIGLIIIYNININNNNNNVNNNNNNNNNNNGDLALSISGEPNPKRLQKAMFTEPTHNALEHNNIHSKHNQLQYS